MKKIPAILTSLPLILTLFFSNAQSADNCNTPPVTSVGVSVRPLTEITNPKNGAILDTATVTVSGTLYDFEGSPATVTVNGTGASADATSFAASGISLSPGLNTITAVAAGPDSMVSRHFVRVWRVLPTEKPDLKAHQPGKMAPPHTAVPEADEDDPVNLIVMVNDDNDDGNPPATPPNPQPADNDDTIINADDNDIVKLTLKRLPPEINTGILELSVTSGAADIRIFNTAGNAELTLPASVDLGSPSGYLADLATGDLDLYLEGLNPNADVRIKLVYKDSDGKFCSDEVRLAVIRAEIDLYKVNNGPQIPDADEETIGTNLSINNDDDNNDNRKDNSDTEINGTEDMKDMARVKVDVQPGNFQSGTIRLTASDASKVRIFSENGQAAELPVTVSSAGPVYYYAEGLSSGTVTLGLESGGGPGTSGDKVRLVIGEEVSMKLTFDDGPCLSGNRTQRILDTLESNRVQNGIRAVFFVQTHASNAGGSQSVRQLIADEAKKYHHHVEVHTGNDKGHNGQYYHTERIKGPRYDANGDGKEDDADGKNALEGDLIRAKERIKTLTGRMPVMVRPPAREYNTAVEEIYQKQNLIMQLWDVDTEDWRNSDSKVEENLRKTSCCGIPYRIRNGKTSLVILFHDIKENTASNLGKYLKLIEDIVQHEGKNAKFDY